MQTLMDAMARELAERGVGAYSRTAALPPNVVPISVAGFPGGNGRAIVLTTYPGGPEPDSRNGWEYPRLQVKVRHQDPLEALSLDRAVYDELHPLGGLWLPGDDDTGETWWLQDCYALQSEATSLGRDDNGRWQFARNYQLTARPS